MEAGRDAALDAMPDFRCALPRHQAHGARRPEPVITPSQRNESFAVPPLGARRSASVTCRTSTPPAARSGVSAAAVASCWRPPELGAIVSMLISGT